MKIRNICFALLATTLVSCGNNKNGGNNDLQLNKEEFVKELSNLKEPADSNIYERYSNLIGNPIPKWGKNLPSPNIIEK